MAAAKPTVYTYVTKTPGVCGGKARIEGTRVRVNNVACLHKEGATDEKIREAYPDLTPAQIHAALACYYDNREEIDAELEADAHFFVKPTVIGTSMWHSTGDVRPTTRRRKSGPSRDPSLGRLRNSGGALPPLYRCRHPRSLRPRAEAGRLGSRARGGPLPRGTGRPDALRARGA